MTNDNSTIFALSSGRGKAGIAVIRISGPQTSHALEQLGAGGPAPRKLVLCALKAPDSEEVLGASHAEQFAEIYDVSSQGNWEGVNILNRLHALEPGSDHDEQALANFTLCRLCSLSLVPCYGP